EGRSAVRRRGRVGEDPARAPPRDAARGRAGAVRDGAARAVRSRRCRVPAGRGRALRGAPRRGDAPRTAGVPGEAAPLDPLRLLAARGDRARRGGARRGAAAGAAERRLRRRAARRARGARAPARARPRGTPRRRDAGRRRRGALARRRSARGTAAGGRCVRRRLLAALLGLCAGAAGLRAQSTWYLEAYEGQPEADRVAATVWWAPGAEGPTACGW